MATIATAAATTAAAVATEEATGEAATAATAAGEVADAVAEVEGGGVAKSSSIKTVESKCIFAQNYDCLFLPAAKPSGPRAV